MSRHFSATILLETPWKLDVEALADAVRKRYPEVGRVEAVLGEDHGLESGLIRVEGASVVITASDAQCDPSLYTPALKVMRSWNVSDAIARHTACLTIDCGGTLAGLDGAEAYAAVVHLVTAAALPLGSATAVLWHDGYVLSAPLGFVEAASELLQGKMPVAAWVSFATVVPKGYAQDSALGMVTYGLHAFLGRELELAPRPCKTVEAYRCVVALARRALDQGIELFDGLRLIDPNGAYNVTVRERSYWLRRDQSAFVLVAPDAVVEVDSLRPRGTRAA